MWQLVTLGDHPEGLPWEPAVTHCDTLDYGGHQDWYLPDSYELSTMLDPVRRDAPVVYQPLQGDLRWVGYLWASSPLRENLTRAAAVDLRNATPTSELKVRPVRFRCVRREPPAGRTRPRDRYSAGGVDGHDVVDDAFTGLQWRLPASPDALGWEAAVTWCADPDDSWRLPNRWELESIVDDRLDDPVLDLEVFSLGAQRPPHLWTTTRFPLMDGTWFRVRVADGQVSSATSITGLTHALCVRSAP